MNRSIGEKKQYGDDSMSMIFLSLLLVLITFFIVLTRFVVTDPEKVERFRRDYSRTLFLGQKADGPVSPVKTVERDIFSDESPLKSLINRMKSTGITAPLMNQFLTIQDIKTLRLISGESGLVLRMPDPLEIGGDAFGLSPAGRETLEKMKVLFLELPFLIEVKGVGVDDAGSQGMAAMEMGVKASQSVYRHLIQMGVVPQKIKITGTTTRDSKPAMAKSFVELAFRETY